MQVADMMTARVVSVDPYDRLEVVREIFANVRFRHLLVVEERKLVGVLSDRDYFKAISPTLGMEAATAADAATLEPRVHQIMTRKLITVSANAPLRTVVDKFLNNRISCLPVVNGDREPEGIVSWRDVMKLLKSRAKALEAFA
ncbi:MAG: CBS domain-containing protein [Pseudomonadota bacterium]